MLFSRMTVLPVAIGSMIVFSLFVQMSEGATYSVVPFINKKALGSVAGIVGAGGNMGAVGAGFLFRAEGITWPNALLILGVSVFFISFVALLRALQRGGREGGGRRARQRRWRSAHASTKKPRFELPRPAPGRRVTPFAVLRIYLGHRAGDQGHLLHHEHGRAGGQMEGSFGNAQNAIAWFVVLAHSVGGTCLALGFATRFVAAINAVVLWAARPWCT